VALPVATGIGSRTVGPAIPGMFMPGIPAIPAIPPAGFGRSGGGVPAFGIDGIPAIPAIPPIPLIPPMLELDIPGIPVALGNCPFAIEDKLVEAAEAAVEAPEDIAAPKLDAALAARLGIAFAGLLAAALAAEETTDPTLDAVFKADVTAGRLPLPLPSGATQPLMPGRFTQRDDGA